MLSRRNKKKNNNKEKGNRNDNRINLVTAIIFLLLGTVLFRLYSLQVLNHDLYIALAASQHNVYSKLKPTRGQIFIQGSNDPEDNASLYPIATNKEFALVYAKPYEIEEPEETAKQLYELFDKEEVEAEVDKLLDEDEQFQPLVDENGDELPLDKERAEYREIKRELEIKTRQEEVLKAYIAKLSKENDPYEPIRNKVDEDKLAEVLERGIKGIDYMMEEHRYYPEKTVGSNMIGFLGFNKDEQVGRYGLEGFFNEELTGIGGSVRADRDAKGEVIIINDREYNKAINGSDLILTIDKSIEYAACTKLEAAALRYGAESGSVLIMDPATGAIMAMCSWPNYDPNNYSEVEDINRFNNPIIFDQYEPGSVFKPITMAAALDQQAVRPDTTYQDNGSIMIEGWPKPIKNSDFETYGPHGIVDMTYVLEHSLNTGAIWAMEKIGSQKFADYVKLFGFGEKTGIELETETSGNIERLKVDKIRPVEAATASFGQGITVTPLQMANAYAAIANDGILMKPYLVKEIVQSDGNNIVTQPRQLHRVISSRASILLSGMMVNVIEGGHAVLAAVDGYYVAGKTGTAQVADKVNAGYSQTDTIHTFVGFAPADDPAFVMLVKLNRPTNVQYAASSAAPLFGEIAEFVLQYLEIPKER